jgi:hypothetical protein
MKFKFSDCTELVEIMPTLLQHWIDEEEEEQESKKKHEALD